ncbi:MAG: protein-glutamate O-methyltransferase CheR [Sedimenticola sp.]|nr:protein-glutamate O-methyltransferase CheR [Sedimenticola sp.]
MQESQREFVFKQEEFDFLRKIVNARTGIVVADEKLEMFYSRLVRRLRLLKLDSFAAYCGYIREDITGNELLELTNAITTNLTAFFREPHHFNYLADTLIPSLVQHATDERLLRVWSAGCSTGEEAYSLAMTLDQTLSPNTHWDWKLLSTDIDSRVLHHAAEGVYPADKVAVLPEETLKHYFLRGKTLADQVKVKPALAKRVKFGQLNLMEAWGFKNPLDIIFCRNVIIYFERKSKIKLIDKFADALKPGGHLFLGHSESLYHLSDRFESLGNTIYRKIE